MAIEPSLQSLTKTNELEYDIVIVNLERFGYTIKKNSRTYIDTPMRLKAKIKATHRWVCQLVQQEKGLKMKDKTWLQKKIEGPTSI